jgi:lycopene cyclase domain-containing protein
MSLYFILMLGTLIGPLILSFDKKVHFHTYWRYLFPSIFTVASFFLIWDEVYTQWAVWGFNPTYLQGWYLGHLPIEEVCFFLFVPYACVFVYECIKAYFPDLKPRRLGAFFALLFSCTSLVLSIVYIDNLYTGVTCLLAFALTIAMYYGLKIKWYGYFVVTFLVVQIPFFLVNGALTGMFTTEPIVWYNVEEIIGVRLISIPIEDILYNYTFLLLVFYFYHLLKNRTKKRKLKN